MSNLTHAVGGLRSIMIGKAGNLAAQLTVTVVLSRLLTVDEFGVVAICASIAALIQVFAGLGMGPALVQRLEVQSAHIYSAIWFACLVGVMLFVGGYLLSPSVAGWFGIQEATPVLRFILVIVVLESVASIFTGLAQRSLSFRLIARTEVLTYTIGYALPGLALGALGFGVWALAIGLVTQAGLRLLVLAWWMSRRYGLKLRECSLSIRAFRELFSFGAGYTFGAIASHLATNGDNLVIGRMLSQHAVGLYSRAYQVMVFPANLFGQAIDTVLFPLFSIAQKDHSRFRDAYLSGLSVIASTVMPVSCVAIVSAPEIVAVLLGSQWQEVVPILIILSGGLYFRLAYKFTDAVTRATGRVNLRAVIKWIYAGLVVGLAFVGSPHGIVAVAALVCLAIGFNYLGGAALLWFTVRFSVLRWARIHVQGFGIAATVGLIVFGVRAAMVGLGYPSLLTLVVCFATSLLVLAGSLLMFPRILLDDGGRQALNHALKPLISRNRHVHRVMCRFTGE